jgi:methionine--tRNA ligase beta chain
MDIINIDDLKKIDLRIGKIVTCQKVEGSEKLLKLEVDFGSEIGQRQIISGIAKSYEPEFLIGKQALFIVNLEPREIMGMQSNGMILCATLDNLPIILEPEKEVLPGSQIK